MMEATIEIECRDNEQLNHICNLIRPIKDVKIKLAYNYIKKN